MLTLRALAPIDDYLAGDDVVQIDDPEVRAAADRLLGEAVDRSDYARRAFEFVRDEVAHSWDADDPRVTVTAREVLESRVGLCYAKSHLLAALLRIGGVPTALCYQWLVDDEYYMLHGLVAVHLDGTWHRLDARGNKDGVDARFDLAVERLAWPVRPELGERDFPTLHVSPPQPLVRALRSVDDIRMLATGGLGILPDQPPPDLLR
ncbi:transglutaminase family protein [Rhodococcus sp. NPDC127528]|uniref:transglutaminase-like domain-containing protein n=1 Tax=unclassified Rhodococcus (in: high G+C Gram-positive bacteria) TaxID=192944 RepID=UPI003639E08A